MHRKRYIYIILILILSMLMSGCRDETCDQCDGSISAYMGDPAPLKGKYLVTMKQETQSTSDKLLGKKPERREIKQVLAIDVKDPKTLVARTEPDGEPFYLDYDQKTGKAKGRDSQGYAWEIRFAVEFDARYDEDYIILDSVKRKGTSLLGTGSDNAQGESKTGIFYKYHGRWHENTADPGRQGHPEYRGP